MDIQGYDALVGSLDNLFPELDRFDVLCVEKLDEVRPNLDCRQMLRPALIVPILTTRGVI